MIFLFLLVLLILPFMLPGRHGEVQASREDLRLLSGAARQAAKGDTATALQVVERLLSQPGRNEAKAMALYLKGVLEFGRGATGIAEAALRDLLIQYPGSSQAGPALAQLGMYYYRIGEDTTAVSYLQQVAVEFADSSFIQPALMSLARAAERGKFPGKAIEAYLQYLAGSRTGHI